MGLGPMELAEFQNLREKIAELIRSNESLRKEKKAYAEKILLRERQIQELKARCERYERGRREAYRKVDAILSKLEGVK
mgnify:CR=1 FL=1